MVSSERVKEVLRLHYMSVLCLHVWMSTILTGRGKVNPESVSLYVCGLLGCPYSQVTEEKYILKVPPYISVLCLDVYVLK